MYWDSQCIEPSDLLAMKYEQRRFGRAAGFTLIEMMVAIMIAAILLLVASPSFVTFKRNSELTSTANSLVAAISAARAEALKKGVTSVVIPLQGADWSTGWTVFIDTNNNQLLDPTEDIIAQQTALPSYFSVTGQATGEGGFSYIMFDPSGYSRTANATFQSVTLTIARNDLSGPNLALQTRIIIVGKSGRVRACNPSIDLSCTSTATE